MPSVTQEHLLSLQISSSRLLTMTFSTHPSQGFSDACEHGRRDAHRLAWAAGCNTGALPAPGRAGRLAGGRVGSMGRYPIPIKAQSSFLRKAAGKAQLPGWAADPWAGKGRQPQAVKCKQHPATASLSSPHPLNNCPSVQGSHAPGGLFHLGEQRPAEGSWGTHSPPSPPRTSPSPSPSRDGINAAFQCHGQPGAGCLQQGWR